MAVVVDELKPTPKLKRVRVRFNTDANTDPTLPKWRVLVDDEPEILAEMITIIAPAFSSSEIIDGKVKYHIEIPASTVVKAENGKNIILR